MKKTATVIIAALLALVMAVFDPARTMAVNAANTPVYFSEFKVGMGKKASEAEAALAGYTIITDSNGNKVDFNDNAGGGLGSKGDRVVYIGYKTTTDRSDAITDIALMNMKGGYSTEDYDALLDTYINAQIVPFVDSFMAAIREYRENYNSSNAANKTRAQYIHDALNKFTDDDCNGAPLGDLLLNQTKSEMGDAAYNALSDAEKAKHADLVTIIAQSNGAATLMIENLLVRAADTAETTWLERLSETTYDDLLDETGLSYTKAVKELDQLYYDDAMEILEIWDTFKAQLENYDGALAQLESLKNKDYTALNAIIENYDVENTTEEESIAYGEAVAEIKTDTEELNNLYADVMCKQLLEIMEYDGGTLLDFFTMSSEEIEEDPSLIYPLIASLSDGQRAGIEFLTLEDLVMIGATDVEGYKSSSYDDLEVTSIYEGVNRGIYEPGGVGLTSDALRSRALENMAVTKSGLLSPLTYVMLGLTSVGIAGLGMSVGIAISASNAAAAAKAAAQAVSTSYSSTLAKLTADVARCQRNVVGYVNTVNKWMEVGNFKSAQGLMKYVNQANESYFKAEQALIDFKATASTGSSELQTAARLEARSANCSKLAKGVGAAVIILVAITTYLTWRDLKNHYKVDYTPIPRYMVDEKDITAYNSKGEKIVIKNQDAYYTAVTCNRDSSAEYYKVTNDIADLNGDVGQQWLAMYCAKNEAEAPILADSLKIVIDDVKVPSGYTEGIHMFGVGAAENFNNPLYVWNSNAKSIYAYYKKEAGSASSTGSLFTAGSLAISGGAGLAIGALASAVAVKLTGRKKKKEEEKTA